MIVVIILFSLVASFSVMELVAWSAHKYLMHGLLWHVHQDHHHPVKGRKFEKNDLFFIIFAAPAAAGIWLGVVYENPWSLGLGIGTTVYGILYFLVHDVLIHRRFKWFDKTQNRYLVGLRKAHKVHHKNMGKEGGECFGMLFVPFKFFRV